MDGSLIAKTIAVFQPLSERPLTAADAEEMIRNVVGLFSLLERWAADDPANNGGGHHGDA